jgi:hypothetical protein
MAENSSAGVVRVNSFMARRSYALTLASGRRF